MKKNMIIFVMMLSVLVVSCSSDISHPRFNGNPTTGLLKEITIVTGGNRIVFSAIRGLATTQFEIANTYTVTTFGGAFGEAANEVYPTPTSGSVVIKKNDTKLDVSDKLTEGEYEITYSNNNSKKYVYTLTVRAEGAAPMVELTASDLTLINVYTSKQIEIALRTQSSPVLLDNSSLQGGDVKFFSGGSEGTIIAGTKHSLSVGDVITPDAAITYKQSDLLGLFNKSAVPSEANYTIDDFVTSVNGQTLTLTSNITAKDGYSLPVYGSLNKFVVTIRIGNGTSSQDKWTQE